MHNVAMYSCPSSSSFNPFWSYHLQTPEQIYPEEQRLSRQSF